MKPNSAAAALTQELKSELTRRQRGNPSYSLRSFAKNLEINPGYLSEVMRGKAELSLDRGIKILTKMGYDPDAVARFLCPDPKNDGRESIQSRRREAMLSLDTFKFIADWYHMAMLELTRCEDFQADPKHISKRLGITALEAKSALERLKRLGLLKTDRSGKVHKVNNLLMTPSGTASESIKTHHTQMIEKAKHALRNQSTEERDITSIIVAVNPSALPELKAEAKRFRRRIAHLLDGDAGALPTEVYQVGVQIFRISDPDASVSPPLE